MACAAVMLLVHAASQGLPWFRPTLLIVTQLNSRTHHFRKMQQLQCSAYSVVASVDPLTRLFVCFPCR
jgi:hypothetical protein